jgi:hypothetical protein
LFADFLRRLLDDGAVVLSTRPVLRDRDRSRVSVILANAFADRVLDVAGPLIAFDPAVALRATECLGAACWFLVSHGESPEIVEQSVQLPEPDDTPGCHLSADVVLRYLPTVYRRARALASHDVLTRASETILRHWPLSGVLADIIPGPQTPLTFGGHPGLALLYAERLAERFRPAWIPTGPGRAYVELVFSERSLRLPSVTAEGLST